MRKITRNRALTLLCAALTITLTTLAGFSLERTAKASVFETVFTAVSNAGAIITGTSPAPSKDTKKPAPLGSNPERIMFSEQAYENGRWVDKIRSIDPALAPQTPSDLGSVEDFEPAIAPSGNSIVFSSLRDAPPEGTDHDRNRYRRLYSMNADGSDQVRQPTGNFIGAETSPSISPDGTTVVYVADYSYGGQPQGIYTSLLQPPFTTTELISDTSSCGVPVAKRTPRRENAGDLYIGYNNPNFTPDGLSVIFGYDSDNFGMAIYKVEVSTGNCTKLADTGSYANPNAVISPDGTQIAFYYED
ncbi:MAG: Protein TolB [Acidobacteria bacterium OLB17]|nr:MAG: Protein TolB [Acidobacteria bacterium OLB17]